MGAGARVAHHAPMPASSHAPRLLLFADGPRAAEATTAKVRRYRLARLQPSRTLERRPGGEPRYEYLKRSYD